MVLVLLHIRLDFQNAIHHFNKHIAYDVLFCRSFAIKYAADAARTVLWVDQRLWYRWILHEQGDHDVLVHQLQRCKIHVRKIVCLI